MRWYLEASQFDIWYIVLSVISNMFIYPCISTVLLLATTATDDSYIPSPPPPTLVVCHRKRPLRTTALIISLKPVRYIKNL
jgi:hypothetical protein